MSRSPEGQTEALTGLSARQLQAGYAAGSFTPVEVVRACLARIAEVNPTLNAHWHVAANTALAAAEEAGRRFADGTARVMEGIPVGVKDTIDVSGMPCTLGSRLYSDRTPTADAAVIERIRRAGAIVLTKDATSEFAFGSPYSPLHGLTTNPWRPGHWAGGSSAGGAAGVAARCLPLAVGTDAGGSVRAPASWSGVTGLKPTKGRVSRTGVMSVSWTMCTVGVLARTALDAADLLSAMTGYDPADPQSVHGPDYDWLDPDAGLAGTRIGVPWEWAARDADHLQVSALRAGVAALQEAGAEVVDLPTPAFSRQVGRIGYHILHIEAAYALREHRDRDELDPDLVDRMDQGGSVSAAGYLDALHYRVAVQQELAGIFADVDLIAVPTTIGTAPRARGAGRAVEMVVNGRPATVGGGTSPWTVAFNLAGMPAIAVPAGMADGLPLSMQLVAPPYQERRCVAAAAAFQRLTGHHEPAPPPLGAATTPPGTTPPPGPAAPPPPGTATPRRGRARPPDGAPRPESTVVVDQPSCVDGSFDPGHGDAFLRSYLSETVPSEGRR